MELPALCSSKFRPGPPSDYAQYTSNIIFDILKDSGYVKFTDLCIVPDKLAWVLYCDMICFNYDGSLVDACLTALTASLKTCKYTFSITISSLSDSSIRYNKKILPLFHTYYFDISIF